VDNGCEFFDHETVAENYKKVVYFANFYSLWERGLVKNFEDLLRQC